jgi:putative membrane protein
MLRSSPSFLAKGRYVFEMADKKEFHMVPPGSHASEFLASERTFLAWIRTSIAVLSFGFAIVKFDMWSKQMLAASGVQPDSTHITSSIGILMVIFGGVMSAAGAIHYRRANKQILEGKVQASNWLVLSISAGVVLISVTAIIYLILRGEY